MTRWLAGVALVAACSGRDQSLGETTRPPPIIIDPIPQGGSSVGARAGSGGSGGGSTSGTESGGRAGFGGSGGSSAGTGGGPSISPCEDRAIHVEPGMCLPLGSCRNGYVDTEPGSECEAGLECCIRGPGCGANGCGTGGEAGNAADPLAGAGGN